ncbi:hypothetical protein R6Q59_025151 [Mikania micrantha]
MSASGSTGKSTEYEERHKKKQDKQAALESTKEQTVTPKATKVVDVLPVRYIQHSISYDKEEGDIVHCLMKEQIAKLFKLNPEEIVEDGTAITASDLPTLEKFDDVDKVIFEYLDDLEPTTYTYTEEDLPTFVDLFRQQLENKLNRIIDEKDT